MKNLKANLVGQRFHCLMVIDAAPSNRHGQALWVCRCDCGSVTRTATTRALRSGNTKSCGCYKSGLIAQRVGAKHPNWTGGRYVHQDGYIRAYSQGRGVGRTKLYQLEHRLVMERKLGRALLPHETVHHLNGVRDDNRPENLELWVTPPIKGQRPADLVVWAKEIVRAYEPMREFQHD